METETELKLYFATWHLFMTPNSWTAEIKQNVKDIKNLLNEYRTENRLIKVYYGEKK
jgi:hypothetical protein